MFAIKRGHVIIRNYLKSKLNLNTGVPVCKMHKNQISDENLEKILTSDSEYNQVVENYIHSGEMYNCLIIQPYVKWGPKKAKITPDKQLEEAVALVKTLPSWKVQDTISVPLDTLERKTLFKSGSMDKLRQIILKNQDITAIFVNISNLKKVTVTILQENFGVPILDRYRIVMQILKLHATSQHAKLQVALAELYYVQKKAQQNLMFVAHNTETMKLMFKNREQTLKMAIKELREHRKLLRNKREKMNYPVIAVVGYTNSGKTSLIKALTGEESLQPRNQLFATLDVTVHSGILPSGLEVLYVDTIGFLSDIPTNLIECFIATLEEALLADVIVHVEDLSSSCFEYKRNHVLTVLKNLGDQTENDIMDRIIHIGNKSDLVNNQQDINILPVSAKKGIGLETLKLQLENKLLKATSREKITIRILNGGNEIRWLYKNATVNSELPDKDDLQFIYAKVIITKSNLQKFKHHFIALDSMKNQN